MNGNADAGPSESVKWDRAGLAALVVFALFVYGPSLTGGFIWSDDLSISGNELLRSTNGLYKIWFSTQPQDYWPLTNTSYWIEWRLWGLNPLGYHLTNVVLHCANAWLLWVILRRWSIPGAFLAALFFVVHPVNVVSVAWITQRKNTLSMLFFLVSVLCYDQRDRRSALWYGLSIVAFLLAMLSKGSVAVLPPMLLLIAWWRNGRVTRDDVLRTVPFFVIAIALTLVNIWFQTHLAGEAIRHATFAERLAGAGAVVWFYVYKALLPIDLSFIYPNFQIEVSQLVWWLPLLAMIGVTAFLVWLRDRKFGRAALFAWGFYLLAMAPVMGFTDVQFMKYSLVADQYQYLGLLAVCTAVAAALSWMFGVRPTEA